MQSYYLSLGVLKIESRIIPIDAQVTFNEKRNSRLSLTSKLCIFEAGDGMAGNLPLYG